MKIRNNQVADLPENSGWPTPLAGVLNPIDDPYAAAQQMAVAMISSGKLTFPSDPVEAAEKTYEFVQAITKQYLKLRDFYDGSQ
ncbi:hypothetical protein [Pseudomonas sp. GL-B-26]|uniref:hypothetical protein n=1 Tax=Pseudomonas sp. GL-B-26 TaxID=2832394 RepID=UPI001CBC165E|nr:hypothetical protein [Pseudomonas sp. GL-B-26]